MADDLFVGQAAQRLGTTPIVLSHMLYTKAELASLCPINGGRRVIPIAVLPQLAAALSRRQSRKRGV